MLLTKMPLSSSMRPQRWPSAGGTGAIGGGGGGGSGGGGARPFAAVAARRATICRASAQQQQQEQQQQQQRPPLSTIDSEELRAALNGYQAPDEMSLYEAEEAGGRRYSSHARELRRAYTPPQGDAPGVAIALGIIAAWAAVFQHAVWHIDLAQLLQQAGASSSSLGRAWAAVDAVASFLSLEFLSTALFITAHDSMHGSIAPKRRFLNDVLGATAVSLYAWFSYEQLWKSHWAHHNATGRVDADPDFHGGDPRPLPWFVSFMSSYVSAPQVAKLVVTTNLLVLLGRAPIANLAVFWAASGLLSAWRLFYFGTYLPHRPRRGRADEEMAWVKARSSRAPAWLEAARCLLFGLHWEHHRFPNAPWWDLPRAREIRRARVGSLDGGDE